MLSDEDEMELWPLDRRETYERSAAIRDERNEWRSIEYHAEDSLIELNKRQKELERQKNEYTRKVFSELQAHEDRTSKLCQCLSEQTLVQWVIDTQSPKILNAETKERQVIENIYECSIVQGRFGRWAFRLHFEASEEYERTQLEHDCQQAYEALASYTRRQFSTMLLWMYNHSVCVLPSFTKSAPNVLGPTQLSLLYDTTSRYLANWALFVHRRRKVEEGEEKEACRALQRYPFLSLHYSLSTSRVLCPPEASTYTKEVLLLRIPASALKRSQALRRRVVAHREARVVSKVKTPQLQAEGADEFQLKSAWNLWKAFVYFRRDVDRLICLEDTRRQKLYNTEETCRRKTCSSLVVYMN